MYTLFIIWLRILGILGIFGKTGLGFLEILGEETIGKP
jgi:hypothetical protein